MARYLYQDGVPDFGSSPSPSGVDFARRVESRPAPAPRPEPARREAPAPSNGHQNGNGRPPGSGKGLFAWGMDEGKKHQVDVIKKLNEFGREKRWPNRMIEWDGEMVGEAHAFAVAEIAKITPRGPEDDSQEPPADEPDDVLAGPCTIRSSDGLSRTKLRLRDTIKATLALQWGYEPSEAEIMDRIDYLAAGFSNGEAMVSLRDCADFKLINAVDRAATEQLKDARAAEAIK